MKTKEELENELAQLKGKYTTVYTLTVPLNDAEDTFANIYLRKPDRIIHAAIGKLAGGNDPLKAVEYALKNLYVGGDDLQLIMNNEDALFACESPLVEMMQRKQASLKKN